MVLACAEGFLENYIQADKTFLQVNTCIELSLHGVGWYGLQLQLISLFSLIIALLPTYGTPRVCRWDRTRSGRCQDSSPLFSPATRHKKSRIVFQR